MTAGAFKISNRCRNSGWTVVHAAKIAGKMTMIKALGVLIIVGFEMALV